MPPLSPPGIDRELEQYNKRNVSQADGGNYSGVMSSPVGRAVRSSQAILLAVLSPPTVRLR